MKQLNSKKTRFPRFDKILVIQPIAEVYGEGNERQLCEEIGASEHTDPNYFLTASSKNTVLLFVSSHLTHYQTTKF